MRRAFALYTLAPKGSHADRGTSPLGTRKPHHFNGLPILVTTEVDKGLLLQRTTSDMQSMNYSQEPPEVVRGYQLVPILLEHEAWLHFHWLFCTVLIIGACGTENGFNCQGAGTLSANRPKDVLGCLSDRSINSQHQCFPWTNGIKGKIKMPDLCPSWTAPDGIQINNCHTPTLITRTKALKATRNSFLCPSCIFHEAAAFL